MPRPGHRRGVRRRADQVARQASTTARHILAGAPGLVPGGHKRRADRRYMTSMESIQGSKRRPHFTVMRWVGEEGKLTYPELLLLAALSNASLASRMSFTMPRYLLFMAMLMGAESQR